jgi:hypothetical protein
MRFSSVALALAALSIESVFAGAASHRHAGLHLRRERAAMNLENRAAGISATGTSMLTKLGFGSQGVPATGLNEVAAGGCGVWIGSDGTYTNTFHNNATNEVVLVVWGSEPAYQASFPMAVQPLVTASIASGCSLTLSFAEGQSGAWSMVYPDTTMTEWGQIDNTWGEYTFAADGVVDVSREVNMNGNTMEIVGPSCTTNMDTCSFQCTGGATTCGTAGSYQLVNCAGQPGANNGDGINGGCGWPGASTVALKTYFNK